MPGDIGGSVLGIVALSLTLGGAAVYWAKVKALRVPLYPVGLQVVMVSAMLLALLAFFKGPGLVGGVAASLAVLMGGLFLIMTLTSRLPEKRPAVAVGRPVLDFSAMDADGNNFTLSSLRGKPVLLKFFRGWW